MKSRKHQLSKLKENCIDRKVKISKWYLYSSLLEYSLFILESTIKNWNVLLEKEALVNWKIILV